MSERIVSSAQIVDGHRTGRIPSPIPWPVLYRGNLEDSKNGLEDVDISGAFSEAKHRSNRWNKCLLGVFLLGLVVYIAVDFSSPDQMVIKEWFEGFLEWVEENIYEGVLAFACVYALSTILFVPGVILTVGAGLAFGGAVGVGYGVLMGSIAVSIGAVAGSVASFFLGRYVCHEKAQEWAHRFKVLKAINLAIEKNGIKMMVLLRLSPLVPYSAFNYVAGLTKVSSKDYLIGCLGIIPGVIAFVFIGASTSGAVADMEMACMGEKSSDRHAARVELVVLIVGICTTVLALIAITVYARRILRQALDKEKEQESCTSNTESGSGDGMSPGDIEDSFEEKKCEFHENGGVVLSWSDTSLDSAVEGQCLSNRRSEPPS